ncbi:GON-4-like protein isoform X2 [Hippocampus zosterae]|uniref:GON-4-like protein isoform X2 n=1 Tax=Hippocampus zosterae TaxID=109293 RepID=UPI00223DB50D|nr:GON-4-like protein isoform X2 [Hippocampus zosterae]XP_051925874.1 GON-4-like protein isoform X2 [Hippocampus zosterae]
MKSAHDRAKAGARDLASQPHSPDREDADADAELIITTDEHPEVSGRRMLRRKRKRQTEEDEEEEEEEDKGEEEEQPRGGLDIDRQLDQLLESKSKQHKLTSVNVRNIIHEVITNEHVVAMMKAAINQTEAVPPFEPKMTRSKLKEVVEKGVAIPAWNISPIKKSGDIGKGHQFVDIPLAEEDSSDEEYRPDDEDEDETAEDTLHESDLESAASPARGSRPHVNRRGAGTTSSAESGSSMGPPPPPPLPPPPLSPPSAHADSFLEKLHAVEAELAVCMEPYRPLEDSGEGGLMAYRTRSKRPLRDVPLGRLEAELRAPDITPDMYDCGSANEDSNWTDWLRGLMTSDVDNDEECDDEDDPEYNFLADIDEPDQEDYRDDKAVRITKKEVNELMEELFETLKEDLRGQEVDDEGHDEEEEEESREDTGSTCDERLAARPCHALDRAAAAACGGQVEKERLAGELRTVKQQLAFPRPVQHAASVPTLRLDARHRSTLAQQIQQHVQLLLQVHLLASPVEELRSEAETTRHFLFELDLLAQRGELMLSCQRARMTAAAAALCSAFRASNLQGALKLLDELRECPPAYVHLKHTADSRGQMRSFPVMPAELAWIFATRPVFLYPQLLPCVSLDPALYCPRRTAAFTAAEDCLLVMGLRNLEGSRDPTRLLCQLLLSKSVVQVKRRILECCRSGTPDNVVKAFRYRRVVPRMPPMCAHVAASERRPPAERDVRLLPLWLVRSLPVISKAVSPASPRRSSGDETAPGRPRARYPPHLPANLRLRRGGFVRQSERGPRPRSSASPGPATPNPPSPDCPARSAAGVRGIKEAEVDLPGTVESSRSSGVNEARMTEDVGTSCHLLEEVDLRLQRESQACPPGADEPGKTGSDARGQKKAQPPAVSAQNVSTGVNGEKTVVWTREADRLILTACQQQGVHRKTFRRISTQLGTKSARQVSLRYHDLLRLFRVAATSGSSSSVVTQEPEADPGFVAQKHTDD